MRTSARFTQGVNAVRRYVIDYTLDLGSGETVTSMPAPAITASQGQVDAALPLLVINDIVIGPGGLQVVFYASAGVAPGAYLVLFLATTSIGQVLDSVVAFNIKPETPNV